MNRSPNRIEDQIIGRIDRDRAPKPVRDRCETRLALEEALRAYAEKYGWSEARGWAAARAYAPAAAVNGRSDAALVAAEQVFSLKPNGGER